MEVRYARTVYGSALQPSERRPFLIAHSVEVARHMQRDFRLEILCREPAVSAVRMAHHNEWLPQSPCRCELEHALA